MDLFSPRNALTEHLEKLVKAGIIRDVQQAEAFAEVMYNHGSANHATVYVVYDKSKKHSAQGKNSIKSTEVYTVILAWRNNRPERSCKGHVMYAAGEVKNAIEFHIHGWTIDNEYHSANTGKPFLITDSPEALYRSGSWAFYPMSFEIDITRTRPTIQFIT